MEAIAKGKSLNSKPDRSNRFKNWISVDDEKRCLICGENHGKVYLIQEKPDPKPPIHIFCRCKIEPMLTIMAGTATINGKDGADWTLLYEGKLPQYYIGLQEAFEANWDFGKWPSNFIPGKMITLGAFRNANGHLPTIPGRCWYEADINYTTGKRNNQRVLWSNDGLVFVTYDHYATFYEIVGE